MRTFGQITKQESYSPRQGRYTVPSEEFHSPTWVARRRGSFFIVKALYISSGVDKNDDFVVAQLMLYFCNKKSNHL